MRLSFVTLLCITLHVCLVSSLQLAGSISHFSSHHNSYIDHKIRRQSIYISLNHELYHGRDIIKHLDTSINVFPPAALPATIPQAYQSESLTVSTSRHSSLSRILPSLKAMAIEGSDAEDWSNQVGLACSETFAFLNRRALSLSGISACYNVRAFDQGTGAFDADLRLYRIAASSGDWMRQSGSIDVGVEYRDAGVNGSRGWNGNDKGNGGAVTIEMPTMHRDEAKEMWRRRADVVMPKILCGFTLAGVLDGNVTLEGSSEVTFRELLTPTITLLGIALDGTVISANLSLEENSFVTGLFAMQRAPNTTAAPSDLAAAGFEAAYVLPGTTMVGSPTGLIMISVWSLLLLLVEGCGVGNKLKARNDYRRRLKQRLGGGGHGTLRG